MNTNTPLTDAAMTLSDEDALVNPDPAITVYNQLVTLCRRLELNLAREQQYLADMDRVIDDFKVARSCINPLEDLRRAVSGLVERAEKAENELADERSAKELATTHVDVLQKENSSFRTQVAMLREALTSLRDIQNGPPLVKWTKEWNEAMEATEKALAAAPESIASELAALRQQKALTEDPSPITEEWLISEGFKRVPSHIGPEYGHNFERHGLIIWEYKGTGRWLFTDADQIEFTTRGHIRAFAAASRKGGAS